MKLRFISDKSGKKHLILLAVFAVVLFVVTVVFLINTYSRFMMLE